MGSKNTNTQSAAPWAPAQAGLKQGLAAAGDLYASGGFNINPYQGQMVAGQTADTLAAQDGIRGMVPGMQQQAGQATDFISSLTDPGRFDAQRQRVIDSIMPSINNSFAGSGMTGSGLHQQNLGIGLSKGMADAEMGFTQQQMQAAGMLPQMQQAQFAPFQAQMAIGQQNQNQAQAVIDADMQRDLLAQSSDANALKDYMAIMSGIGGQFGTQTATQSQKPGLLGIIGAGAQAASLFSDRRLKENIKRVGAMDDGTPIYTYAYKSGGPVQMGVMADEAPKKAVGERDGFKTVNYGVL